MTADAKYEWVAIIGTRRIPTSAKVIEHYKRVFKELPVRFERAHPDAPLEVRVTTQGDCE